MQDIVSHVVGIEALLLGRCEPSWMRSCPPGKRRLAREALGPAGPAPAFFGTVERMLALRPFDLWAHQQDTPWRPGWDRRR